MRATLFLIRNPKSAFRNPSKRRPDDGGERLGLALRAAARVLAGPWHESSCGVENYLDATEVRKVLAARPDARAAAYRDRENRHVCFEREPRRAHLEARKLCVGERALAFGEDHHRAATAEPLQRASVRGRVAAVEDYRPRAEKFQSLAHHGPLERLAPREEAQWALDARADPERVKVGLMIGRDDEAALRGHVLKAAEAYPPQRARDDSDDGAQRVQKPLRGGPRLGRLAVAALALVGRVRRVPRSAQNESPAPSSRSASAVSSRPPSPFHASLIRATTPPSSASSSLSSSRRGLTPSSEVTFNSSHQSGMSRSLSASAFQRSQRAHSKPVYARASSFVSDRRVRAPHAGSPHQRSTSTSNTSRGNTIRLVMLNSVREVQNAECPSDELKTARLSSFIILHSA